MSTETLDFTCFAAHAAHGPFLVTLGSAGLAVLVGTVVAIRAARADWPALQLRPKFRTRFRHSLFAIALKA
jgi:hypothetical protein